MMTAGMTRRNATVAGDRKCVTVSRVNTIHAPQIATVSISDR